jgi:hypothetical protein
MQASVQNGGVQQEFASSTATFTFILLALSLPPQRFIIPLMRILTNLDGEGCHLDVIIPFVRRRFDKQNPVKFRSLQGRSCSKGKDSCYLYQMDCAGNDSIVL